MARCTLAPTRSFLPVHVLYSIHMYMQYANASLCPGLQGEPTGIFKLFRVTPPASPGSGT